MKSLQFSTNGEEESGLIISRILNAPKETGYPAICKVVQVTAGVSRGVCTGVLITPNKVLSAAHCAIADNLSLSCHFEIHQGGKITRLMSDVLDIHIPEPYVDAHTKSVEEAYNFDYAILTLQESISGIEPMPMMFSQQFAGLARAGKIKQIEFVGYGVASMGAFSEVKRKATFDRFNVLPKLHKLEVKSDDQTNMSVYKGDSGGAYIAHVDGIHYAVGILSYVAVNESSDKLPSYAVANTLERPVAYYADSVLAAYHQNKAPYGFGYKGQRNIPRIFDTTPDMVSHPWESNVAIDTFVFVMTAATVYLGYKVWTLDTKRKRRLKNM